MRIIIDLQGRQSTGSKNRGIGRYSLAISKAIVRNRKDHEVVIVLSSAFPNEVKEIKNEFENLLPRKNIVVWTCPGNTSFSSSDKQHRKTAELSRELFLHNLNPDVIYITSLFEGHGDNVVTSVDTILSEVLVAATLYDLIPLINEKPYLSNLNVKQWYLEKIEHAKRADLLLAISESSRQEALEYLDHKADEVVNIGTSADDQFHKVALSESERSKLLDRYKLKNDFLMYTGGIDHRKNIEGLIRAYALLPRTVRKQYQLAIVCSIDENQRERLETLVDQEGLNANEVIFTGFISEEDLIGLYNLCKVFIFPSWHEGFGLPALEAMWCGAPVIAANGSSLPEVIGWDEALFDPYDDQAMAQKIEQVLTDESFREKLRENGAKQIQKFSWDISAKKAIDAFEKAKKIPHKERSKTQRLRLAYLSPLPPERSGISDYSAELLPELCRYYDIDVVVDQETISDQWILDHCGIIDVQTFRDNSTDYDRVLYHFGNSQFHSYMFGLLLEVPGVVVLHDFYLSGADHYDDTSLVSGSVGNQIISDYAKGVIMYPETSGKQYVQAIETYYSKKTGRKEGFSELKARVVEAEAKVRKAEERMNEVEEKVSEARDHYSHISNSFSYRVTKPLRTVRGYMKKGTE